MLRVRPGLTIPLDEVVIRASRSSGPGGQHANVTASRIEVSFDVFASEALGDDQKRRIAGRLGPVVRAVAQETRSQTRHREIALQRLEERLGRALAVRKPRRATKPSKGAMERRLQAKRRQSDRKKDRRPPDE